MELQGFDVKFMSAKALKLFYLKYHPGFDEKKINIYEMALFFLQMHKGSSFFFDEVPFIARESKSSILILILSSNVINVSKDIILIN